MLSLPRIIERNPQPYVAVRERLALRDMKPVVDKAMGVLFGGLKDAGVTPAGPVFFKYDVIDMSGLCEIEFAVPVAERVAAPDHLVADVLPAGRYAELAWTGPYDALFEVNAVLAGWAAHKGLRWDARGSPEGDRFAARLEIYERGPSDGVSANEFVTTVAIKVTD
ncbi:MAG: GyrI-like domain-containing protein [Rhizobiaceae bacterium]|nr:GyrI-like domain-containing protein [Rhizobiaceae bacterium]